jgi:hypothetical protein
MRRSGREQRRNVENGDQGPKSERSCDGRPTVAQANRYGPFVTRLSDTFGRPFELLATLGSSHFTRHGRSRVRRHSLRDVLGSGIAWADEVCEMRALCHHFAHRTPALAPGAARPDRLFSCPDTVVNPWLMEALGDFTGFAVSLLLVRHGLSMAYACHRIRVHFHRLATGERTRRNDATSVN